MEKPAILIIGPLPPPHTCGMRYVMVNLLASRLTDQYQLIVLDSNAGKPLEAPLLAKVVHAAKISGRTLLAIQKYRIRIAHIHTASYQSFYEKVILSLLCHLFRVKVILHIHGAEFDQFYNNAGRPKQWLIRRGLNIPAVIICLSQRWKHFFSTLIDLNKLAVVPNGVDVADLNSIPLSFSANDKWTLDEDSLVVLFLGHMIQRKGLFELCEAATRIKVDVNWQLVLAGDGAIAEQIRKKYIAYAGQPSLFRMIGVVAGEEKRAILQRADIFVLPSYAEGLPVALLEAMAVGLPVVTTSVGAIPELVKDGQNGFLVAPGDVNALAKCIELLLTNGTLRHQIREQNQAHILKEYDNNIMASKLSEVYDMLLAGGLRGNNA